MSYEITESNASTAGTTDAFLSGQTTLAPNNHGKTVNLSTDGNTMLVFEPTASYNTSEFYGHKNTGRGALYKFNGTSWVQQTVATHTHVQHSIYQNYIHKHVAASTFVIHYMTMNGNGNMVAMRSNTRGVSWFFLQQSTHTAYNQNMLVKGYTEFISPSPYSNQIYFAANIVMSYYGYSVQYEVHRYYVDNLKGTTAFYNSGASYAFDTTNGQSILLYGKYGGSILNRRNYNSNIELRRWGKYMDLNHEGDVIVVGDNYFVRVYRYNASHTFTYGGLTETNWEPLGGDIYPEDSSTSGYVAIAKSFTFETTSEFYSASQKLRIAIGSHLNDGTSGVDSGHVRIYEYDATKTTAVTDQSSSDFGPIGWRRLGQDIDGEAAGDQSGQPVKMNQTGTLVGIKAPYNDDGGTDSGHIRFYKYNSSSNAWSQVGNDLDGNSNTGYTVGINEGFAFSAQGNKMTVGHVSVNSNLGVTKTYDLIRQTVPQLPQLKNGFLYEMSSISEDVNDTTYTGTTVAQKRAFTKNAVKDILAKYSSNLTGNKKIKLKAGNALPGITDAVTEDVFLFDARSVANFDKDTLLHKTFYMVMDEGTSTVLPTRESTVTVTQNANDFTIVSDLGTVTKVAGDTFEYDGLSVILGSIYGSLKNEAILCFNEGTQITCMDETTKEDIQIPIQEIQPGQYVKTYKHGYIQAKHISYRMFENPDDDGVVLDRLYICEQHEYPELTEPLILTGCHSLLVDDITDVQRGMMTEQLGQIYVTDDKYRLLSMYDTKSRPYTTKGEFKLWHICLDHYDPEMNYGIYANGLLVESCSERNIKLAKHTIKE